jgi:hypothetical protein
MPARVRAESRGGFNEELLTDRTNYQGDRAAGVTKWEEIIFLAELLDQKPKTFVRIGNRCFAGLRSAAWVKMRFS